MKIRNTYKRITAAVLSAVLLLSLAACKESEKKPDTETNKPSVTTKTQDTKPADQSDTTEQQKTPSEPEKVSPVYTDWSKLTPYEPKQRFTYHAGYCADEKLEARDDYGTLLPYFENGVDNMYNDWYAIFSGLVNDKGELITAPVYKRIDFYDDFIVLTRSIEAENGSHGDVGTIAAPDGHWVHELYEFPPYINSVDVGDGVLVTSEGDSFDVWNTDGEVIMHVDGQEFLDIKGDVLVAAEGDNSLVVWSTDGEVITHIDGTVIKEKVGYKGSSEDFTENFFWNYEASGDYWIEIELYDDKVGYIRYGCYDDDNDDYVCLYLDLQSGELMDKPPKGYPIEIEAVEEEPKIDGYDRVEAITDYVSGKTYFVGYYEHNRYLCIFDSDRNLLIEDIYVIGNDFWGNQTFFLRAGLYSNVEDDYFCYRSLTDKELIFCYPMHSNED